MQKIVLSTISVFVTTSELYNEREVDRVGFEPTTSAMPMPHPTGLDDRPSSISAILLFGINTFNELQTSDGR